MINRSGSASSNAFSRFRILSQTQLNGIIPAVTVSATKTTRPAPKRNASKAMSTAAPTLIQTNSTVRSWTSARSSMRLILCHCFRCPSACSVTAKIEESASLRRSLRFFFALPLPSPVCARIRLRTHEPRMPARKKRHPKSTSTATAIAIASGPPGPYAFVGRSFDGSGAVVTSPAGIFASWVVEPAPTIDAVSRMLSPGRAAVTYWTRHVFFSAAAMEL